MWQRNMCVKSNAGRAESHTACVGSAITACDLTGIRNSHHNWFLFTGFHDWIRRLLEKTTLTASTLTTKELDVAILAPSGSPRVLHEPIVLAIFGTIANGKDPVVKTCATQSRKNAWMVQLEN